MRVAPRDNQGKHRKLEFVVAFLPLLEQDGVDVAFKVVDGDERLIESESERLRIADSDEEGAGESGPLRNGYRVDRFVSVPGIGQGLPHHWYDGAQMFAGCKFGDDSAVRLVRGDLRRDHVGNEFLSRANDGGRSFIAGAFDAENEGVGHVDILVESLWPT